MVKNLNMNYIYSNMKLLFKLLQWMFVATIFWRVLFMRLVVGTGHTIEEITNVFCIHLSGC